jgi:hypothetical protein
VGERSKAGSGGTLQDRTLEQLLVTNASVAELGAHSHATADGGAPGLRSVLRLLILLGCLILIWTFAEKWILGPLLDSARKYGGYERVEGHRAAILASAEESGVDPYLIAGIVFAESSGRVNAKSGANALGLMQLMMPTAKEQAQKLGLEPPAEVDLLTNPELNIRLGANYFAWVIKHELQVERSLVAYNAGRGRLRGWIKEAGSYEQWRAERIKVGNSSTLTYASRVMAAADEFRGRALFAELPSPGSLTLP